MTLRNLPGGVPEPDELIGRDHLIDVLWHTLEGNNVLLIGPRRFGKTAILRHVLKRPRQGYLPLYIDVGDVDAPEGFAAALLALVLGQSRLRSLLASAKRTPEAIRRFTTENVDELGFEGAKLKLRQSLGESWRDVAKRLILEMEKLDQTVVFIIDEFAQMVDNIAEHAEPGATREVLAWFRSLRMRQRDELRKLRFVIAGSTSIDMVLRQLQAVDKLNDFGRLPVEPLAMEHGQKLLDGLAQSCNLSFTPEAIHTFFDLVGPPVPYFIHLFVLQLRYEARLRGKALTPDDIREVYQRRLIGPTCHAYFDYFRQRLKRYGAPGQRAAIAILRALASASTGRVSDAILYDVYRKARKKGATDLEFREIMADLERDWYVSLDTTTNEYYFVMNVMRAWWNRFYRQLGTTPGRGTGS